ncbi:MAG: hypothetical protein ACD_20C00262G0006 [uncultured bacterium]|nr:MAG: hypothetical protein ACD_20C00262G0006 [uncultured bacterium]
MRNSNFAFKLILAILVTVLLSNKQAICQFYVDFDGTGKGNTYGGSSVPMPATPSPPPSSNNSQPSKTYTKPKTYSKPSSSLLTPQMRNDIVDSVYAQMQAQAKQKALAAKKQAELEAAKKKQEEAKKKKEALNWIRDYQGTAPKIDNLDTPLKSLDDSDPTRSLKGSYVPSMGQTKNPANDEFTVPKLQPQTTPVSNMPKTDNSDLLTPGKTEGELRAMYYGSDREIMQCASGQKECSTEYVKALQMKRLTAEQGLTIHYNYKEVKGNFIKNPR